MMFDFLGVSDPLVLVILALKLLFPRRLCARLRKISSAQRET